jgi:hypothetical protein
LPASNQYANVQHKKDFYDKNKKSKIYINDRKSAIQMIVADNKFVPGIGKYNITEFDEKRIKPPKGTYTQKEDRVSSIDEALFLGKKKPGIYEAAKLVSFFLILSLLRTFITQE